MVAINFKLIMDLLYSNKLNILINYLYDNINNIIYIIKETQNPQKYDEFDLYFVIYYFSIYQVDDKNKYLIPIIINRLINYIIRQISILQLDGNQEINYQNNYQFYINIGNNNINIKLLILQLIFFYYESLYEYKNHNMYFVGIDFEFDNNHQIALCQICLFPRKSKKYIWIFDPKDLNNINKQYLIDYLYIPKSIYKIFHGSDSLDIPYLFNTFFNNNKKIILKFINRMIDTRFICEYYKIAINYENKKCSIYDGLLYFNTINNDKYKYLNNITKKMGKIYKIIWNIKKMNKYHIEYTLYDVLYLREFLFDILRKSKNYNPELNKNLELIPEITRFVFLEKWNIENLLKIINNDIVLLNNYFIINKNDNFKLIEIYNQIINVKNNKYDIIKLINDILNINYFKSSLTLLFKYIIYSIIISSNKIYKTKNIIYINKLDYNILFIYFDGLKMYRIINILNQLIKFTKHYDIT